MEMNGLKIRDLDRDESSRPLTEMILPYHDVLLPPFLLGNLDVGKHIFLTLGGGIQVSVQYCTRVRDRGAFYRGVRRADHSR